MKAPDPPKGAAANRFAILSNFTDPRPRGMGGDRDGVLAEGFDGDITRPITPETFVPEVEGYLRKRG